MRKRREVSRCADGALRWDAGVQPGVDQPLQELHQLRADSRKTLQEAREFQYEHQTHDAILEKGAGPCAMRQQDVPLQQRALRSRDASLGQQTEAGVDSVSGSVCRGEAAGRRVRIRHRI